ncbi:MAG TPA: alpha/beta hydrolase [Mycobacterium sp.]
MTQPTAPASFVQTPTPTVAVGGTEFVYRNLGTGDGVPLVALTHLGANLDSWDPEVVDPLARDRRVILIGYRGAGASTGTVRDSVEDMASDAIAVIRALGLSRVDLFGLSMGGMVAQAIITQAPELVDRLILAGSGPQGGPGLTEMTGFTVRTILRGVATFTNPTTLLFFTRTPRGKQAARAYQARLKRRRAGRDKPITPGVFRAQLRAVNRWGQQHPTARAGFTGPVLIMHGDSDRMVPPGNADLLAARFPAADVRIYPDSGHGVVFQNHGAVTNATRTFLRR